MRRETNALFGNRISVTYTCQDCGTVFESEAFEHFRIPILRCDPCGARLAERDKLAERTEIVNRLIAYSGIPEKYGRYSHEVARKMGCEHLLQWIRDRAKQSIWLGGVNGVGKTHASHFVALERIKRERITVKAVRCSKFCLDIMLARQEGSGEALRASQRMIDEAIRCDLLILDDLGKERMTAGKAEVIWELVDCRDRHDRIIWITTNVNGDTIEDRLGDDYGPAVLKRLRRMIPEENRMI